MPGAGREIDDDVAGPDDLAQGAFVSRHAMTVAEVEAVLVDYPGHEEGTEEEDAGEVGRSGAKPRDLRAAVHHGSAAFHPRVRAQRRTRRGSRRRRGAREPWRARGA